jgi:hypothetical protein
MVVQVGPRTSPSAKKTVHFIIINILIDPVATNCLFCRIETVQERRFWVRLFNFAVIISRNGDFESVFARASSMWTISGASFLFVCRRRGWRDAISLYVFGSLYGGSVSTSPVVNSAFAKLGMQERNNCIVWAHN